MPAHGDPTCAPRTETEATVRLTAEQADHVRDYVLGQINADLDTGVLARDFTGIEDIERLRDILRECVRDLGALGEKGTPVDYTASRDALERMADELMVRGGGDAGTGNCTPEERRDALRQAEVGAAIFDQLHLGQLAA